MPCDEFILTRQLCTYAPSGSGKLHFVLGQFSIFTIDATIHLSGDDSTVGSVMLCGGTLYLVKIFYTE